MDEGTTRLIKKYGNRRLYDTEASRYITLEDLADLIRAGSEVKVVDAKTQADLTKGVLLQIIAERDRATDLFPLAFLKRMIALGDSSLREALQRYLTNGLDFFLGAQRELGQQYQTAAQALLNPAAWAMPPFADLLGRAAAPLAAAPGVTAAEGRAAPPPEEGQREAAVRGVRRRSAVGARRQGKPKAARGSRPAPSPRGRGGPERPAGGSTGAQIRALKAQLAEIRKLLSRRRG